MDVLERRGYLHRAPDPSDGRARLVRLTPRGRRAARVAREEIAAIELLWLGRYRETGFMETATEDGPGVSAVRMNVSATIEPCTNKKGKAKKPKHCAKRGR